MGFDLRNTGSLDYPESTCGLSGLGLHSLSWAGVKKGPNASLGMPLLWGLASGSGCFVGLASFLGLVSGPVSLIFQTLSVAP